MHRSFSTVCDNSGMMVNGTPLPFFLCERCHAFAGFHCLLRAKAAICKRDISAIAAFSHSIAKLRRASASRRCPLSFPGSKYWLERDVIVVDRCVHHRCRLMRLLCLSLSVSGAHELDLINNHLKLAAIATVLGLPLAVAQLALKGDLGTLGKILRNGVCQPVERNAVDKVRAVFLLTGLLILDTIVHGNAETGDAGTRCGYSQLGVAGKMSDDDNSIDCHDELRSYLQGMLLRIPFCTTSIAQHCARTDEKQGFSRDFRKEKRRVVPSFTLKQLAVSARSEKFQDKLRFPDLVDQKPIRLDMAFTHIPVVA